MVGKVSPAGGWPISFSPAQRLMIPWDVVVLVCRGIPNRSDVTDTPPLRF